MASIVPRAANIAAFWGLDSDVDVADRYAKMSSRDNSWGSVLNWVGGAVVGSEGATGGGTVGVVIGVAEFPFDFVRSRSPVDDRTVW